MADNREAIILYIKQYGQFSSLHIFCIGGLCNVLSALRKMGECSLGLPSSNIDIIIIIISFFMTFS